MGNINKYVFTASQNNDEIDYEYVFESDKGIETLYKLIYKIMDMHPFEIYVRMLNDTCIYIPENPDSFYVMTLDEWLNGHVIKGSKLHENIGVKLEDFEL